MPIETQIAVNWALQQMDLQGNPITKDSPQQLVDKVRDYFNANNVTYSTFSYDDLVPYLNQQVIK